MIDLEVKLNNLKKFCSELQPFSMEKKDENTLYCTPEHNSNYPMSFVDLRPSNEIGVVSDRVPKSMCLK